MMKDTLLYALAATFLCGTFAISAEPNPSQKAPPATPDAFQRTREQAVAEAALLQDAMHTILQVVHHRYYKEDEGLVIPAATMREVFEELERDHHVKLRWLVVEGQAMNAEHIARDEFEKAAVQALLAGEKKFESFENGVYRRAGPVTLSNVCLKCHIPDRRSTEDRTAGLIVTIPLRENAK